MTISVRFRNGLVVFSLGLILISGCAGIKSKGSITAFPHEPASAAASMGWWAVRFQNEWPEGVTTEWYMDDLIAHRVVAPVLETHREQIPLWRFHRRAARDGAGHRFSFIFYSDADTASEVIDAVRNDSLVEELMRIGRIRQVISDDTGQVTKPGIGDTSDQSWSPVVQNTWPYFIMGVSKTWLEMIDAEAGRQGQSIDYPSIETLQEQYRSIDDEVRKAWQTEGHHAFLHHLNAVFGYTPIIVDRDVLRKF